MGPPDRIERKRRSSLRLTSEAGRGVFIREREPNRPAEIRGSDPTDGRVAVCWDGRVVTEWGAKSEGETTVVEEATDGAKGSERMGTGRSCDVRSRQRDREGGVAKLIRVPRRLKPLT